MTDDDMTAPPAAPPSPHITEGRMLELLRYIRAAEDARQAQREAITKAKEAVGELRDGGISLRQIAAATGVPWPTIRNWAGNPET